MTVRFSIRLLISTVLIFLANCVTAPKSAKPQAGWMNNMHKLSVHHLRLMPIVADGKKFADPNQRDIIAEELKEFAQTATAIANDNKAPDADPLIAFNARSLANDAKQAYAAYQVGDLQWSRFAFNRTSAYCIGCHTRADRGIKDFEVGWTTELSTLSPSQTVEFLLANRKYRSALTKASVLASDRKSAQGDPRTWLLTIEKVMGMVVRVKKDPAEAEALARLVYSNQAAPYYLRRDAASWLKDIREWRNERHGTQERENFKTAVRLVGQAQKSGPRSTAMLIPYLRASGILHELAENTRSPKYGEVLLYAGIVADSLRDLNLGFLDQFYYESCIVHEPHSDLAERCYDKLELSIRDADPFLDLDPGSAYPVVSRLAELRKLAESKDPMDDPRWLRRSWEDDFSDKGSP